MQHNEKQRHRKCEEHNDHRADRIDEIIRRQHESTQRYQRMLATSLKYEDSSFISGIVTVAENDNSGKGGRARGREMNVCLKQE